MIEVHSRTSGHYLSLAWWPNRNKIAISNSWGNSIWLFDAYGTDPQKDPNNLLVSAPSQAGAVDYMDWSPDGSMLAYTAEILYNDLYIVNNNGTDNRKIILKGIYADENIRGNEPCWSLNNRQIIFAGFTGIDNQGYYIPGLFVTDIDGSYLVDIRIPGDIPDWY